MPVRQLISTGAADFAGYVRSAWSSSRQRRARRPITPAASQTGADGAGLSTAVNSPGRWEDYSDLPEEAQQAGSVILPAQFVAAPTR